jgi:manganese/zinc/iron transport system substrate-binding protein
MKKLYFFVGLIVLIFICTYVYFFYVPDGLQRGGGQKRIVIVCTTSIIADLMRILAQEHMDVIALMGPGVDPHVYRPTAGDMQRLARADIIVYNGLHLEGKIEDVFANIGRSKNVIMLADALSPDELIETSFAHVYDPHLWHDVQLWKKVARYCAEQLSSYDTEHTPSYMSAAQTYCRELEKLDADIRAQWNAVAVHRRVMITAHDAFAYYGRAYGIIVVGLQGISTDAHVSMHDVQRVVDIIIAHNVAAIFTENCIPERTMKAVCDAVHAQGRKLLLAPALFADSLGDTQEGGATYEAMMRYNTQMLVQYLGEK